MEGLSHVVSSQASVMKKSPFPGMDPYIEQDWLDAHTSLITYICDQIQEQLPAELCARIFRARGDGVGGRRAGDSAIHRDLRGSNAQPCCHYDRARQSDQQTPRRRT